MSVPVRPDQMTADPGLVRSLLARFAAGARDLTQGAASGARRAVGTEAAGAMRGAAGTFDRIGNAMAGGRPQDASRTLYGRPNPTTGADWLRQGADAAQSWGQQAAPVGTGRMAKIGNVLGDAVGGAAAETAQAAPQLVGLAPGRALPRLPVPALSTEHVAGGSVPAMTTPFPDEWSLTTNDDGARVFRVDGKKPPGYLGQPSFEVTPWAHFAADGTLIRHGTERGLTPTPEQLAEWQEHAQIIAKRAAAVPQTPAFIRWGELPPNGRSKNFATGKPERGVSAFHAEYNPALDRFVYGESGGITSDAHIRYMIEGRQPYLLHGTQVGVGSDGEPVLARVKIHSPLTYDEHGFHNPFTAGASPPEGPP